MRERLSASAPLRGQYSVAKGEEVTVASRGETEKSRKTFPEENGASFKQSAPRPLAPGPEGTPIPVP